MLLASMQSLCLSLSLSLSLSIFCLNVCGKLLSLLLVHGFVCSLVDFLPCMSYTNTRELPFQVLLEKIKSQVRSDQEAHEKNFEASRSSLDSCNKSGLNQTIPMLLEVQLSTKPLQHTINVAVLALFPPGSSSHQRLVDVCLLFTICFGSVLCSICKSL